jgi:hypothetical protein
MSEVDFLPQSMLEGQFFDGAWATGERRVDALEPATGNVLAQIAMVPPDGAARRHRAKQRPGARGAEDLGRNLARRAGASVPARAGDCADPS